MTIPKNIQLWLDALRSGDYDQYRGALEGNNSYCCLGVACRVANYHGTKIRLEDYALLGGSLDSQPEVQKWLGLYHDYGETRNDSMPSLVKLNDTLRLSFEQIADHIEAHWTDYVTKETVNENS